MCSGHGHFGVLRNYWQGSDSSFVLEDSTIRPPNSIGSPGEAVVRPAVQGVCQDSLDREDWR